MINYTNENVENQENIKSGRIRNKRNNFSMVSNTPTWQKDLTWEAKGVYMGIQSLITIPNFVVYKNTVMAMGPAGKKAFDRMWKELKDKGYLIQYRLQDPKTKTFYYEYELLDEPNVELATKVHSSQNRKSHNPKRDTMAKGYDGKRGVYNNTLNNNTVCKYVSMYEKHLVLDGLTENFIRSNNLDEKIELDLFETILVETINNKRVKLKDRYFRKKITEIINKGIRTIQDYEKSIDEFNKSYEVSNSKNKSKGSQGQNNSSNDKHKVHTRFHNVNSRLTDMSKDYLEETVAMNQYLKFNNKTDIRKVYIKAMNLGLSSLSSDDIRETIIEFAQNEGLEVPK